MLDLAGAAIAPAANVFFQAHLDLWLLCRHQYPRPKSVLGAVPRDVIDELFEAILLVQIREDAVPLAVLPKVCERINDRIDVPSVEQNLSAGMAEATVDQDLEMSTSTAKAFSSPSDGGGHGWS
jgi:hypothetical protein